MLPRCVSSLPFVKRTQVRKPPHRVRIQFRIPELPSSPLWVSIWMPEELLVRLKRLAEAREIPLPNPKEANSRQRGVSNRAGRRYERGKSGEAAAAASVLGLAKPEWCAAVAFRIWRSAYRYPSTLRFAASTDLPWLRSASKPGAAAMVGTT
jgi:hypothetical protein